MDRRSISLAYSAPADKARFAQAADDAGFDEIWNAGESIAVFGAMAASTRRARIGSGVVRAFATDPRTLAIDSIALQEISGGRYILGLGGGTKRHNINQLGQAFDHPATRIREIIAFLRSVWATPPGTPVAFDGTYIQQHGTRLLGPRRDRGAGSQLPIYLAAVNAAMLRLAGDRCDGLCGHPIASVRFMNEVAWPAIDIGLAHGGRSRANFDHQAWIITAISPDQAQALREVKVHMGRFMATRSYAVVLDAQGLSAVRAAVQEAFFDHPGDDDRLAAAIPDEVAADHAIFGTPDDVRHQAERYVGVATTRCFYCASAAMTPDRISENITAMIETFGR